MRERGSMREREGEYEREREYESKRESMREIVYENFELFENCSSHQQKILLTKYNNIFIIKT